MLAVDRYRQDRSDLRNELPGVDLLQGASVELQTFRALQASSYALKFLGKLSLNIKATPLPMTPTVFTVLTSASASASNRFPSVKVIITGTSLASI